MTPIAAYLDELSGLLRRRRRRRILAEVHSHLLDAAAADALSASDPQGAELRAVERFGRPARVASQFNALRRRPGTIIRRGAAVTLAGATMATLGTATVWALQPGAPHVHPQRHHAQHAHRTRREENR